MGVERGQPLIHGPRAFVLRPCFGRRRHSIPIFGYLHQISMAHPHEATGSRPIRRQGGRRVVCRSRQSLHQMRKEGSDHFDRQCDVEACDFKCLARNSVAKRSCFTTGATSRCTVEMQRRVLCGGFRSFALPYLDHAFFHCLPPVREGEILGTWLASSMK